MDITQYFTNEINDFFAGLALNNERGWFDANRKTYEQHVKKPFQAFLTDAIAAVREFEPIEDLPLSKFQFRINRDIRFSHDKTPYTTWVSASISRGGKKDYWPGFYIRIGVEGLWLGGGMYAPEKNILHEIRSTIAADEGAELRSLMKAKKFKDYWGGELTGDKNKIIAKELKEAAAKEPLIFNKGWFYSARFAPDEVLREDLLDFVVAHYKAGQPINEYFKQAMAGAV